MQHPHILKEQKNEIALLTKLVIDSSLRIINISLLPHVHIATRGNTY